MTAPHTPAFWIDAEYDREYASDGVSRYAAYVRDGKFEPWTDNDRAVELAVFAWERATSPVMSPGYVRRHPRILTVRLERSGWDGSLLAVVDLVIPQPQPLQWLRSDDDRDMWRDWPRDQRFGGDSWREPDTDELAGNPYLLCTASLRFTVPSADLPDLAAYPDLVYAADDAVTVLVRELNVITGPVLDAVNGRGRR